MALILFGASASGQVYRQGITGGLASSLVTADAAGSVEVFSNPTRAYLLRIPMQRVTAVIAANSIVWGVHNGTTFNMSVRRFELSLAYDAALATTTSEYQFIRWSAPSGTNLTGGTALGAVKRATTMNVSTIADARFSVAAALGVVGIVFEADPFYSVGSPRINGASGSVDITAYESQYESVIQLAPNEGLALRLGVASAIGDSIGGMIGWTER